MSGAEVFGVVAGASQLAVYIARISASIAEIYRHVHNAPKRIQEYTEQIRKLLDITKIIQDHGLLQRRDISIHLFSTIDQAKLLSETLTRLKKHYIDSRSLKRYWKILKGDREREILASFVRLEQEKVALLLCMSVAHTDLLADIQNNLSGPQDRASASMPGTNKRQKRSVSTLLSQSH